MRLNPFSRRSFLAGLSGIVFATTRCYRASAHDAPFPRSVDLAWLARRALQPGLRLLDVSPLHVWHRGHIDSASHAWWRDTVDPNYPVFGAVLTQGDDQRYRQQVLDSLDLTVDDDVVVYDNVNGFRSARLVWFLRFLGFEHAAMLNAGYGDWKANAFSIVSTPGTGQQPRVDPQQNFYLVTAQLMDRLDLSEFQLVDIRTDHERSDNLGGAMPPGQIPGSIRVSWDSLLDETGHLRTPEQIRAMTRQIGLDTLRPTALYGSFGVDTALPWLALTNAGFTDLQTYDRGWAEWSITPGLPREPLS